MTLSEPDGEGALRGVHIDGRCEFDALKQRLEHANVSQAHTLGDLSQAGNVLLRDHRGADHLRGIVAALGRAVPPERITLADTLLEAAHRHAGWFDPINVVSFSRSSFRFRRPFAPSRGRAVKKEIMPTTERVPTIYGVMVRLLRRACLRFTGAAELRGKIPMSE